MYERRLAGKFIPQFCRLVGRQHHRFGAGAQIVLPLSPQFLLGQHTVIYAHSGVTIVPTSVGLGVVPDAERIRRTGNGAYARRLLHNASVQRDHQRTIFLRRIHGRHMVPSIEIETGRLARLPVRSVMDKEVQAGGGTPESHALVALAEDHIHLVIAIVHVQISFDRKRLTALKLLIKNLFRLLGIQIQITAHIADIFRLIIPQRILGISRHRNVKLASALIFPDDG